MNIRFGSWNVNNRRFRQSHHEILDEAEVDLLACQEVSPSFHAELTASGLFDWGISSLDLRPPQPHEGRSRRLGCSLFGRGDIDIGSASLVPDLAFGERALVCATRIAGTPVTACSFHTPPGASWGQVKPETLVKIGHWVAAQAGHVLFGIDANCPKSDHPNISHNEWWWPDEQKLLGLTPIHQLRDALRLHLASHPETLAQIIEKRPGGPLAISHVRGNKFKRTDCRYDFIYVSRDFGVVDVRYEFDEKVRAASDHALVVADLVVPAT